MIVKIIKVDKHAAMSTYVKRDKLIRVETNLFYFLCWPLPSQWIGSSMVGVPKIHWVPHLAPAHTGARVVGEVNVKRQELEE